MDFGFCFLDFGFWISDFGLLDTVWILHMIFACHAGSGRRIFRLIRLTLDHQVVRYGDYGKMIKNDKPFGSVRDRNSEISGKPTSLVTYCQI